MLRILLTDNETINRQYGFGPTFSHVSKILVSFRKRNYRAS